ncbi:hemolysin family protein [Candidatus Chlorohelix sp.]|uniref:hemolysin family protein n=1 Tax=Candidatus Chlorohelix sp. TaxID=3139201 RepID=UPI003028570E
MEANLLEYLAILVLVLLNAFFAASEIALVTVRKSRVKQLADEGNGSARSILRLTDNTGRFLSTIQIGVTLAGFFASAFGAVSLVKIFEGWFKAVPLDFVSGSASTLAFIIVTVLIAFISLIFGELVPKTLAVEASEKVALFVAHPIEFISKVANPLVAMLTGITNFFVRLLGGRRKATMPSVSQEEIVSMVETGQEEGVLEKQESDIINRVFEFTDRQVREIMIPRMDVLMLDVAVTIHSAAHEIVNSGYSRYPVHKSGNSEHIIGVAYAKDILKHLIENQPNLPVSHILRKPYFIPESKRVGDLLAELQKSRTQMAIVIDEYGGLAGIVTLEDCIEEIVGDIQDEYDMEESRIKSEGDGRFLVDGATTLNELNEALDLQLEEEEVETISGLVLKHLGRIAAFGDVISLPQVRPMPDPDPDSDEITLVNVTITLRVEKMEGVRIRQVALSLQETPHAEE